MSPRDDLGPRLGEDDQIHFTDSHRPVMGAGTYEVSLEQEFGAQDLLARRGLTLIVAGPRFALTGPAIAARFPPEGSTGAFERVLPHVALRRTTLPWDRRADRQEAGKDVGEDGLPWLALLVLTEAEMTGVARVAKAGDLASDAPGWTGLAAEPGTDPDQPVLLLDLPGDLARAILPRGAELGWLTSMRDVRPSGHAAAPDAQANIVAGRLPPAGTRCEAHLVSVERQYERSSGEWLHWSAAGAVPTRVTLVSLAHWRFTAEAAHGDLQDKLARIVPGSAALPADGLGPVAQRIEQGFVPLRHAGAAGQVTASWYRGPLRPFASGTPGAGPSLPARRARDLVSRDTVTMMNDISLAAAWELGRMLALRDPGVGVALHDWKRRMAHAEIAAGHADAAPEIGTHQPKATGFPLTDWFRDALALLGEVPFGHLVPDPRLAPPETISFHEVDRDWIAALMDGAYSIGRTSTALARADARLLDEHPLPGIAARGAIMIRSEVVSGWPDLVVDGLNGGVKVEPVRHARLGRDTLMVLFADIVDVVRLHLHPQAIHFGVDHLREDTAAGTVLVVKDGHEVAMRDPVRRVLDIAGLAAALVPGAGAGAFAMAMIEPVPMASFRMYAS